MRGVEKGGGVLDLAAYISVVDLTGDKTLHFDSVLTLYLTIHDRLLPTSHASIKLLFHYLY